MTAAAQPITAEQLARLYAAANQANSDLDAARRTKDKDWFSRATIDMNLEPTTFRRDIMQSVASVNAELGLQNRTPGEPWYSYEVRM